MIVAFGVVEVRNIWSVRLGAKAVQKLCPNHLDDGLNLLMVTSLTLTNAEDWNCICPFISRVEVYRHRLGQSGVLDEYL